MADFNDEIIVDWRYKYLDELETFSFDNMLAYAPSKFSAKLWFFILSLATFVSIEASCCSKDTYPWLSGMCGNIAAGLIASVIILAYTTHKEKSIAYQDNLNICLESVVEKLSLACNNLYWERRKIQNNKELASSYDFGSFTTKLYLLQVTLTDIYEKIRNADKLKYRGFLLEQDQIDTHKRDLLDFYTKTSQICSEGEKPEGKYFDSQIVNIWDVELEMMRELRGYIKFVRNSRYLLRYGKAKKQED